MSNIKNNFIVSIGNTPLIKLKAASEITGCNIYGKAEFLNPGGSEAALSFIRGVLPIDSIKLFFILLIILFLHQ